MEAYILTYFCCERTGFLPFLTSHLRASATGKSLCRTVAMR